MDPRVVIHNGKPTRPEDSEAGKMRLAKMPDCTSCGFPIERSRIQWFAKRGKGTPRTCQGCAFEERAARSQPQR